MLDEAPEATLPGAVLRATEVLARTAVGSGGPMPPLDPCLLADVERVRQGAGQAVPFRIAAPRTHPGPAVTVRALLGRPPCHHSEVLALTHRLTVQQQSADTPRLDLGGVGPVLDRLADELLRLSRGSLDSALARFLRLRQDSASGRLADSYQGTDRCLRAWRAVNDIVLLAARLSPHTVPPLLAATARAPAVWTAPGRGPYASALLEALGPRPLEVTDYPVGGLPGHSSKDELLQSAVPHRIRRAHAAWLVAAVDDFLPPSGQVGETLTALANTTVASQPPQRIAVLVHLPSPSATANPAARHVWLTARAHRQLGLRAGLSPVLTVPGEAAVEAAEWTSPPAGEATGRRAPNSELTGTVSGTLAPWLAAAAAGGPRDTAEQLCSALVDVRLALAGEAAAAGMPLDAEGIPGRGGIAPQPGLCLDLAHAAALRQRLEGYACAPVAAAAAKQLRTRLTRPEPHSHLRPREGGQP
ncbi:hypothetical protein AB0M39_11760 [Streptomyces sp. NPDC051907]|uniref:hypothetical protein n=1 Tax=Streptomyces sp. NPDC051907 TaxID=3155284 RepID=UPI0034209668